MFFFLLVSFVVAWIVWWIFGFIERAELRQRERNIEEYLRTHPWDPKDHV
jgi:hypothetical protein